MKFNAMFQPIMIGSMKVANRFVMPAMGTNLANRDGSVSQQFIDYYAERAKGGFGLVTIEVTAVDPLGKSIPNEPGLWSDDQIEGYKRVMDECHKYGAKVSVQLHHAGRESTPAITGNPPQAVTSEPCPMYRALPHEMTAAEIYELIEKYGDAARRARQAGADAVEIHGGHSYLIAQFTSETTNHRTDEFGGNFENRMRFAKLVIENIKLKAGNDFPMLYRVSGEEPVPGGNTLYDACAIASYVESVGVNAIHVTYGVTAGAYQWVLPPSEVRAGYTLRIAKEIKKVVSIPVISVGRHTEPYIAENAIKAGMADLISFGRQSIADPHMPNKASAGKLSEVLTCIACEQGCVGAMNRLESMGCLLNPFTGKEGVRKITKADTPKKIMVVGAGPAGLVASWLSAERGHDVTLYEKTNKLGGEFRIASHPPTKGVISSAIGNYANIARNRGVKFAMETEVTEELIAEKKPDAVILCTGSIPLIPNLPGLKISESVAAGISHGSKLKVGQKLDEDNAPETGGSSIVLAHDVLDGKVMAGQKVLIIGGGSVGSELADWIGRSYREATIIEMRDEVALDEEPVLRMFLLDRLAKHGVQFVTGATVKEFIDGGVIYEKNGVDNTLDGFDTVILALGTRAYNPLEEAIKDKVKEVYVVGDALKARKAIEAVSEAADVALRI
jgi:2,4-dienoyl-CoA reductase-like NADH-dependent reductase (Old Yellow Enzyme family)/NADPH-dependent 2,4-dienoyl-CoA reductase/sulfur reductase-like enzyme